MQNKVMLSTRNSNLELYRILTMIVIVIHHYVVNSGLLEEMSKNMTEFKSIFLYIIGGGGKAGINCFVLITGYFMCKSSITLQKFLKLILQITFYNIVINLLFVVSGHLELSFKSLLWLWPINQVSDYFTDAFILFYLFIPFLTILVQNITQRQHKLLLLLTLFIYTGLYTIPWIFVNYNYITWFSILFLIASYIRLYPIPYKDNVKFWGVASVISIGLGILSILAIIYIKRTPMQYYFVADSNSILALSIGVCTFMFFKNLKIKQSKWINIIASTTFGVLLIHANSATMRTWLWKEVCDNVGYFSTPYIYLHALAVPLIVFVVCSIIEFIRMKTIERPLLQGAMKAINIFLNQK